jgi:hypothetical protein
VGKISRTRPHVQDVWNINKYSLEPPVRLISSIVAFSGDSFVTSTFFHRMASPWCSPSKPNAASFFCFDLSIFFLFASSAFFKAKTVSTDACSKGGGT